MKVNRNLLYKMITEALDESAFQKLMRLIAADYEHAKQAMDLIDFVELSPEEDEQINQAYVSAIVMGSDSPGRDLKEFGYDFHQVFIDVYGFPPPMDKEFTVWGAQSGPNIKEVLSLRTTVYGEAPDVAQRVGHDVEFEFWWDMQSYDYDLEQEILMEPWFRFETMHGKDGYVVFEKGVIRIDEDEEYSEEISKEQLPSAVRSAMGLPWDADIDGWPELPLGNPPEEGSDIEGPVDPPFEGKRKLNRNYLFEVINEVLQEDEERELSEKEKIENMIRSNNGGDFVWGLEMCHMLPELCTLSVPQIIDSQILSGKYAGNDWVFLLVKTKEDAQKLHWYLRAMRPKSLLPSRKNKGAYIFYWPAGEGSPFKIDIDMEYEEGDYIVEIVLDLPEYELTSWGSVKWAQENLIREDEDDEGKEISNYQLMSNKLDAFISSPSIENFRSGWNLIEAMSGLMAEDEENQLKDRLFMGLSRHDLIEGNEEFAIEIVDSVSPKEERIEFEHLLFRDLRAIGQYELAVSNALKDLNIDVEAMGEKLMLMTGGDQEKLEKAKARLLKYGEIEEHFEIDTETGGLLVGPMAKQFATFAKKMEEIFGVAPRGDVDVGYGSLEGLFVKVPYPTKGFVAPIARNQEVSASVVFEYSALMGYGLEITLYPEWGTSKPNQQAPGHDDYYGIWVDQWKEGPNIGKLEIGIQSEEDDFEDNKSVQNDSGGYGFTKEEMKKKILELTGMDLDALN